MIHYADPHFPVLCIDAPSAVHCDYCHNGDSGEEEEGLPLCVVQTEAGEIDTRMDAGMLTVLGVACCTSLSIVQATVLGVINRHVMDSVEGCAQCELAGTLK